MMIRTVHYYCCLLACLLLFLGGPAQRPRKQIKWAFLLPFCLLTPCPQQKTIFSLTLCRFYHHWLLFSRFWECCPVCFKFWILLLCTLIAISTHMDPITLPSFSLLFACLLLTSFFLKLIKFELDVTENVYSGYKFYFTYLINWF